MRKRTDKFRAILGLVFIASVTAGHTGIATAQSSTQPNTIPGTQHIIIRPGPPSGPGSLAPNPPPPPPPRGSVVLTPNKPDPDKPRRNPDRNKAAEDPAQRSDPAANARTANMPGEKGRPDRQPRNDLPDVPAVNPAIAITRSRLEAMESSALNAPRPTFSLLDSGGVATAKPDTPRFEPGQVLVNARDMDQAREVQSQLAPEGYRVRSRRVFRQLNMVVLQLTVPAGMSAPDAVASLSTQYPDLVTDLNHRYAPLGLPAAKRYAHELLDWRPGAPNCEVDTTIGMIDTAVATNHSVFAASDITQLSVLPGGSSPASADHGTGIAALLVGKETGEFAQGLAPAARLVTVEAFRSDEQSRIDTTTNLVIAALDKLLGHQVRVLNLSFGGPANRLLEIAVDGVAARQVSLVAAAGNAESGSPLYPAGYDEVIAVNAVDATLAPLRQGATGDYIDIVAPGVDIWTATANGSGRYVTGSSFATPYVSAFVARISATTQNASAKSVISAIQRTARDLGEPGHDHQFGWGLLSFRDTCPQ